MRRQVGDLVVRVGACGGAQTTLHELARPGRMRSRREAGTALKVPEYY